MLGIADRLYVLGTNIDKSALHSTECKPKVIKYNENKVNWFCFVPLTIMENSFLKSGIVPRDGKVFTYITHAPNIIMPNPSATLSKLNYLYDNAIINMNLSLEEGNTVNVLGVSLGNVLAIRAAADISTGIEKLVSIVGGGRLGISAWESILTKDIAKKSGCKSKEEYEDRLSLFSPVNYTDKIIANEIVMRFGTNDLFIPYSQGKELRNALIERGKKINSKLDSKIYIGADHTAALFLSALQGIK